MGCLLAKWNTHTLHNCHTVLLGCYDQSKEAREGWQGQVQVMQTPAAQYSFAKGFGILSTCDKENQLWSTYENRKKQGEAEFAAAAVVQKWVHCLTNKLSSSGSSVQK